MKSSLYLSLLAGIAFLSTVSCDKVELPYYEGMDAIFFDQQFMGVDNESWYEEKVYTHKLYTPISFTDVKYTDTIVALKVQTTGEVRDYVRPFGVHIVADSTTATQGTDFELIDESYAIQPGEDFTYVRVYVKLTERMYKEQLQIQLALDPGDHFVLPFGKSFGDMPIRYIDAASYDPVPDSRNFDCSVHNIFADCILGAPSNWPKGVNGVRYPNFVIGVAQNHFGTFSVTKYAELLKSIEPRGWTAADFAEITAMNKNARWAIINNDFAQYLRDHYDAGEYILEDDGTLMWIDNPLITWSAEATPADIIK